VKFLLNVLQLNKFRSELLYLSFYDLLEIINQFKVTKNLIFTSILTLLNSRLTDLKWEKKSAVTHEEINVKSSVIKIKVKEVNESINITYMNVIIKITS